MLLMRSGQLTVLKSPQVRQLLYQLWESMMLTEFAMLLQIIYTKTNETYYFISNNYN